ncbi:MAG: D-alanine--D-alanine ligase [Spirochaetales bacterium]|nr:D-alanine--D-alanine ligase [Spirochaetales bacterium]MCF7937858.1 D-alanine--D-alanine ligase [Spirochaetales bacterium]
MNLCILYGGKSGEHEVSLQSAAAVLRNINRDRYAITVIGIDPEGKWYLQPELSKSNDEQDTASIPSPLPLKQDPRRQVMILPGDGLHTAAGPLEIDMVFPVLHGTNGEDGVLQGTLETAGLDYVGAGVLAGALGMEKAVIKRLWQQSDLPVVPFSTVKSADFADSSLRSRFFKEAEEHFGYPVFVKPSAGGSSVGTGSAENRAELEKALERAFHYDRTALIEPFLDARELECSVIGNAVPRACSIGEIIPRSDYYDYESKYLDPDGAHLSIPAEINEEYTSYIKKIAEQAVDAAGIEGMARVDFFLERKSGKVYLNEVNTLPGFTRISMFPKLCAHSGLEFPFLIDRLIKLAAEKAEQVQLLSRKRDYQ